MRKRTARVPAEAPRVFDRDGVTIREAVVLLDKSPTSAQVIAYGADTLVIPNWTGQFSDLYTPYVAATYPAGGDDDMDSAWDVEDAAEILKRLVTLKRGEADEPAEAAQLDKAITAILAFIKAETAEIGAAPESPGVTEARAFAADPLTVDLTEAAATAIREVGKRNSKKDQDRIQAMHDYAHDAGATHAKGKSYAGMQESIAPVDVIEVRIEATAKPEKIRFRESAAQSSAIPTTLREANPLFDIPNRTVWVTPIKPGWGNTRDNNFYPASALREAVDAGRFNGVMMFKDHPRKSDTRELPERSVKDWFATTREAQWDESAQEPRVPIVVHDDAVLRQWADAPEKVAFSVLGGAMARPGSVGGRSGKIVESIAKVGSVDWVTEAGAGGAIVFAESAGSDEEFDDMDLSNLTAEQLREANPTLYAALTAQKVGDPTPTPTPPTPTPVPAPEPTKIPVAEAAPAWFTSGMAPVIARIESIEQRDQKAADATAIVEAQKAATALVAADVAASTLITAGKQAVAARFANVAVGEGLTYATETALHEAVAAEIKATEGLLKTVTGKSNVTGLGAVADPAAGGTAATTVRESLDKRFGRNAPPSPDKFVFSAAEVMSGQQFAPIAEAGREPLDASVTRGSDGASAAAIADGSAGAQDRIGARLGL